jgi:3-hydroxyacyl-[acyl-carrier-protein] dehydratase
MSLEILKQGSVYFFSLTQRIPRGMTSLTFEQIQEAIPHRPPMLLVDECVNMEGDKIHCRKTFREDEYFVQGHYPHMPLVPGVILTECAAQTAAILLSTKVEDDGGVPVLTRIQDARFKQVVKPGDTIDIHVALNDSVSNAFFLTAKVQLNGRLAVRVELACALAKMD